MAKKTPKILVKIILAGVGIVVIAIAINVISGAIEHQKLVSQFAKAEGRLVVEPNISYDSKVVDYLENERSGDSCAAKTIGHDDAWIYTFAWCGQNHKDEGYLSGYGLQGRLSYKATDNKITSSQFIGDGRSDPTIQQLFPYEIYLQSQKEVQNNITKTLDTASRARQAAKN